jgi:outer membrane protein TolC
MHRTLPALVALLAPGVMHASPGALSAYQDEAVRKHPEIRALRAHWRAQIARAPRAGAPPDPMLMVEWSMLPMKYPMSLYRTEMAGVEVSVQQEIPFPGKLRFAEEAEVHAATALAARVEEAARALRASVAQAYFELYFLGRALELTAQSGRLLEDLVRQAEARLATGRGLRQDVLRARTEVGLLRERVYALEARRAAAEARWNYLLSRSPSAPVPAPADLGPPPSLPPRDLLLQRAEASRPLLRARVAEIARAQADLRRAKRNRYPNFLIGAAYRFRAGPEMDAVQGSDFYSIRFGLTLPLWYSSKQGSEVREAWATLGARRDEYEGERNRVLSEVARIYEELAKERRTLPLYEDLLRPLSLETLKAAIPAYLTGQLDFPAVLQSWSRIFETDLDRLRAAVAIQAKAAELEAAVGAPLGATTR